VRYEGLGSNRIDRGRLFVQALARIGQPRLKRAIVKFVGRDEAAMPKTVPTGNSTFATH